MTNPQPPDAPAGVNDPDQPPLHCWITLLPGQINPDLLTAIPARLRQGFRFYGEVTPEEYLQLTGAADYSDLKYRLAVNTEGPEGFGVYVTPEDVLTHETGFKAMQTQVIRWFCRRDSLAEPETDPGYEEMAKSAAEMPYAAIEFLLHLADVYDTDAFNISDQNFAEALRNCFPTLSLDDFAHIPNPKA